MGAVMLVLVLLSVEWLLRTRQKKRAEAGPSKAPLGPPTRIMKLHSVIAWMATGYLAIAWLFPVWEQRVAIYYGGKSAETYSTIVGRRFILTPPQGDQRFVNETLLSRKLINELAGGLGKRKSFSTQVGIDPGLYEFSFWLVIVAGSLLLALRASDWLLRKRMGKEAKSPAAPESDGPDG